MPERNVGQTFKELWNYRVFLKYQCLGKLKLRHTGTYLGYGWWLLDPLLFLGIFYFVFGVVMRRGGSDFVIFLFCALLPWRWFSTSVAEATVSIRSQSALLKQVYYPKVIAPLTSVFTNTVNFMFGLIILAIMLMAFRMPLGINLLYFPFVMGVQLLFTTGLAFLLAHSMVHFRDTGELLRYALQMWFYLSPSVYPTSLIPPDYQRLYMMNPFAQIFNSYRAILMHNRPPNVVPLLILAGGSLLLILLGVKIISRYQGNYAKVL